MKKILVTGKNSYIGMSFEKWLSLWPDDYFVDTVDTIGDEWKNFSFEGYDAVFHVAAIVHKKEKPYSLELYQMVNCDLPAAIAQKAKDAKVKQFVFMSTMSVYGISLGSIDSSTKENPVTKYGISKLNAERELAKLASDDFLVSILRPPMVYGGENCPGNFARLFKLVKWVPIYPDYPNHRSFLHFNNLCEFVRLLIEKQMDGLFYPQDDRYLSSCDLVRDIAYSMNKRILYIKFLNPVIKFAATRQKRLNRLFGDLTYAQSLSEYEGISFSDYNKYHIKSGEFIGKEKKYINQDAV